MARYRDLKTSQGITGKDTSLLIPLGGLPDTKPVSSFSTSDSNIWDWSQPCSYPSTVNESTYWYRKSINTIQSMQKHPIY